LLDVPLLFMSLGDRVCGEVRTAITGPTDAVRTQNADAIFGAPTAAANAWDCFRSGDKDLQSISFAAYIRYAMLSPTQAATQRHNISI